MTRISNLTALGSADGGDTLPILDVSATTTKKITKTAFISDIVNGTLMAAQSITATKADFSVANDAARTALTGFEGLTVYQKDTDATYIYDGSAWRRQAQWEELGRTTLGSAGDTISIPTIAGRRYLQIIFNVTSTGGSVGPVLRFNNDGATNYSITYSQSYGASTGLTSQTGFSVAATTVAGTHQGHYFANNVLADRKLVQGSSTNDNNSGATVATNTIDSSGKWANTSAQITRVDLINSGGAGDFAIGSELIVLGRD